MKKLFDAVPLFLFLCIVGASLAQSQRTITVGAKHFNEGYLLGEMIALVLEDAGYKVDRRFNLGGTAVAFEGLREGAIDVYPKYTGTLSAEILRSADALSISQLKDRMHQDYHLEISDPYGFENTYALLIQQDKALTLGINKVSDLSDHPSLRFGISHEFLERQDGWGALSQFYRLPQHPLAIEHSLAYQAILDKRIDVMDAYSTDGEISRYDLRLLEDDRGFFPDYQAVSIYRVELPQAAKLALNKLTNTMTAADMQQLNARALTGRESHHQIAHDFLENKNIIQSITPDHPSGWLVEILQKSLEHLQLTLLAVLAAIIIALPLGVYLYRHPRFSNSILYAAGIMQTVPSIALLALMIPFFGIGKVPALIALFLYALLPILRNTVIGLLTVDPQLKKVASAIGLNDPQRLKMVELPLAMPAILVGIRTAAVITVGTATLAAFIGAGGLGEFIVTGLALNNTTLILKGAIPSALLAIIIELAFEALERMLVPHHLRQKAKRDSPNPSTSG